MFLLSFRLFALLTHHHPKIPSYVIWNDVNKEKQDISARHGDLSYSVVYINYDKIVQYQSVIIY